MWLQQTEKALEDRRTDLAGLVIWARGVGMIRTPPLITRVPFASDAKTSGDLKAAESLVDWFMRRDVSNRYRWCLESITGSRVTSTIGALSPAVRAMMMKTRHLYPDFVRQFSSL